MISEKFKKDLAKISEKLDDIEYAKAMYSALCNTIWTNGEEKYHCSWRYAGGLIAELRQKDETYLDFYCGGNESFVREDIKQDMYELGWLPKEVIVPEDYND